MKRKLSETVQNPQRPHSKMKNVSPIESRIQPQLIPLSELMPKLQNYRDLKQLPLNPVSQQKQQLWRDSPCTVPYTSRNVSHDKIQRFTIGSIYYKDDINQQKKIFTESQKPQLILKNFRRQIEEATLSKRKYTQNPFKSSPQKAKSHSLRGKTFSFFQNNLYQVPEKIELKYDRNGTRSTYVGQYDVKNIIEKLRSTSKNFSSSKRKDLALPLNFNPGPGEYFTKSEDFLNKKTQRIKRNTSRVIVHQNAEKISTKKLI